jgi:hypothetical protein
VTRGKLKGEKMRQGRKEKNEEGKRKQLMITYEEAKK